MRTPERIALFATAALAAVIVLFMMAPDTAPQPVQPGTTMVPQERFRPIIEERVDNLPNDAGAWRTTVFLGKGPVSVNVERWFAENPSLARLKVQTKVYIMRNGSPLFDKRWKERIGDGATPAVLLQDGTGTVVYKVSGSTLASMSSDDLVLSINKALRIFPRRNRPCPCPDKTPDEKPDVPDVEPLPDTPVIVPDIRKPNWVVPILAVVAAVVLAIYTKQKQEEAEE